MEDSALYERSLPFLEAFHALGRSRVGVVLRKDGVMDSIHHKLHQQGPVARFLQRL